MSETAKDAATPLDVARTAAADAERALGEVVGQLAETRDELAVAVTSQAEWDRVSAELLEELRQTRARLEAIESSRTWQLTQRALGPYRIIRDRLGR